MDAGEGATRPSRSLKERSKNKGNLLSGGEQQMLTIARALMTNPDLIMLDEPSEGLAPIVVQEVYRVIERLKAAGQSILLVEQDFGMAMSVADYAYIMSKGSIVYGSDAAGPHRQRGREDQATSASGVTRSRS